MLYSHSEVCCVIFTVTGGISFVRTIAFPIAQLGAGDGLAMAAHSDREVTGGSRGHLCARSLPALTRAIGRFI